MQELGPMFAPLNAQIEHVIASYAARPLRASIGLWDLLWRLSELHERVAGASNGKSDVMPRAIQQVIKRMELTLSEPLYVGDLAREIGLSHAHLTRLFRAATGSTIAAHIARRRAERAAELLMHTNLPIKTIAAQIGLPDLHQFNKTIRRLLGASPRAIRASG
jgi:transcriptional regulator GlxA family with amidase domain